MNYELAKQLRGKVIKQVTKELSDVVVEFTDGTKIKFTSDMGYTVQIEELKDV